MVQYTQETEKICNAYNLTANEVIFAFAVASNAPLADTYRLLFNQSNKTTNTQCEALANSLLSSKPALKIIINRIKNHKNTLTFNKEEKEIINNKIETEEEKEERRNEFKTREGLITKIIDSVSVASGKDQVAGLTTLAKMMGYDKPDEMTEEEKRVYFLPWVSHCRTCKLMQIYIEALKQPKNGV